MWSDKVIKITPALLFLLCLLEIFEMALIIDGMNNIEKLETQLKQNVGALEKINNSFSRSMVGRSTASQEVK